MSSNGFFFVKDQFVLERKEKKRKVDEVIFYYFFYVCEQVIDETLRLGGIAIWLMREAKEDVKYQGMLPIDAYFYG